jgi:phage terminase small subunit
MPQVRKKDPAVLEKRGRGRPPSTKNSKLTRKQELFVKELISKDGQITMREAAINAGYPVASAHTRAYEMTSAHICPHVVFAIQTYRQELDEKYGVNYQRHLRDLQQIRDMALENGAYSAAVQAEYRRGQAQGDIYVSKSEVRHGSIDSMTKDEVELALKELKQSYEPNIIDVTPQGTAGSSDSNQERIGPVADDEIGFQEDLERLDHNTH